MGVEAIKKERENDEKKENNRKEKKNECYTRKLI